MHHVIVVGGGAAGMGAAWHLLEAGARVTLLERNSELGGRCRSHHWNGHWLIRGAAAFVGGEDEPVNFAKQLALYDEEHILDSKEENDFSVYTQKHGIVNLGGFNVQSILTSSLIPAIEKLRLGAVLPKLIKAALRHNEHDPTAMLELDDQNACEYFRKFSPAFVDYILEPIMNQYCGYSEDDYSLAWLIWLMASPRAWSGAAWTFDGPGVGLLSSRLQQHFQGHPNCDLSLDAEVLEVRDRDGSAVEVEYRKSTGLHRVTASAAVLALPGSLVAAIFPGLDAARKAFFETVQYVPHHIFHQVVDKPTADAPFSLLLPTIEGFGVVSNLWIKPHTDPTKVLSYGEIKGRFCRENPQFSDEQLLDIAWKDICRALPQFSSAKIYARHLQRNDIGLCSRRKGYTRSLQQFLALPPLDRFGFAGDYLINSTVGQSLYSGRRAAEQLLSQNTSLKLPASETFGI